MYIGFRTQAQKTMKMFWNPTLESTRNFGAEPVTRHFFFMWSQIRDLIKYFFGFWTFLGPKPNGETLFPIWQT